MIHLNDYMEGQNDFKNKVLAELAQRTRYLNELEKQALEENSKVFASYYYCFRLENIEIMKIINLIEL